ncbi:MAG: hypothetical protein Q8P95_01845 [bacterium]|nr:hypothetical protein [bacterium]
MKEKNAITIFIIAAVAIAALIIYSLSKASLMEQQDAQRKDDIKDILAALQLYQEEEGRLPRIANQFKILKSGTADVCDALVPQYLFTFPVDPTDGYFDDCDHYNSRYHIRLQDGKVTVRARLSDRSVHVEEFWVAGK